MQLIEEANEEVEHKGWCDKGLASNELTRMEKLLQWKELCNRKKGRDTSNTRTVMEKHTHCHGRTHAL